MQFASSSESFLSFFLFPFHLLAQMFDGQRPENRLSTHIVYTNQKCVVRGIAFWTRQGWVLRLLPVQQLVHYSTSPLLLAMQGGLKCALSKVESDGHVFFVHMVLVQTVFSVPTSGGRIGQVADVNLRQAAAGI